MAANGLQGSPTSSAQALAARAALASGQDEDASRADQLILDHRGIGGIDAAALVRDMVAAPGYPGHRKVKPLIAEIEQHLDKREAHRFEEALDDAGVTDSAFEDAAEKTGRGVFGFFRGLFHAVEKIDDTIRKTFDKVEQWAHATASDPQAGLLSRLVARTVEAPVALAGTAYKTVSAPVMSAVHTVEDVAAAGKVIYRFVSDEPYRDTVTSFARLRMTEELTLPGKLFDQVTEQALDKLGQWETGLLQAKLAGTEGDYLAQVTNERGISLFTGIWPVAQAEALDRLASVLKSVSLDDIEGLKNVVGHASAAIGRDDDTSALGLKTLGHLVDEYRHEGTLDTLVDTARVTGSLETLMRSGQLSPGELTDLARHDPTLFLPDPQTLAGMSTEQRARYGSVELDTALQASLGQLDPSNLTAHQAADAIEALVGRNLAQAGYSDIAALTGKDGSPLQMAARNAQGQIEFFDFDTNALAAAAKRAPGQDLAQLVEQLQRDTGQFRDPLAPQLAHGAQAVPAHAASDAPPAIHIGGNTDLSHGQAVGTAKQETPAANPLALPMSDERHADYPMYRAAVTGLEAEVASRHIQFTDHAELERAAGQLVVEAKASGLPTIARVAAIDGGKAIFAMDRDPSEPNAAAARRIYVDRDLAIAHSVADSTQRASQLDNDLAQALKTPDRDTAIAAR
ncbi:hypothetical protein SAMN05428989_2453 [Pseudoxanthomonas sp. GM95]|uniref:XVIPCD domain-containing protein n=1 Tax=Pseudoxanthomonas sp. GM95 TaxID=1881043 RepID=UPI0008AF5BC8|nr:XVIPCD domain-containing protein [Pseudoxanthomonas sp. GM95]SEL76498.1 hypothetical protein SAMN05428989_2453 [Pseudoxanthomonas sp. GM95]